MPIKATLFRLARAAFSSGLSPFQVSHRSGARGRALRLLPSVTAALVGIAIACAAAYVVSVWEARNAKLSFDVAAENRSRVLQAGLNEYLTKLGASQAMFNSVDDKITRREFENYANAMLKFSSSIQTLSWLPRVRPEDRAAFELAAAREGLAGYHIKNRTRDGGFTPAGPQDEYFPVLFSTVPKTSPLYGLDMSPYPHTREQMDQARDNARLGFYQLWSLASAPGVQHGFVFLLPVYRQGVPNGTVDERRRNLVGFVSGAMVTAKMIDAVLSVWSAPPGIEFFFFNPHGGPDDLPLYAQLSEPQTSSWAQKSRRLLTTGLHWSQDILATSGAPWLTVVAVPTPGGLLETRYGRTWIVLIAGLILTAGVTIYLWRVAHHTLNLSEANKTISELAETDALTTLVNRRVFAERLEAAFASSNRGAPGFAVLYFDLDHFKDVNDTLGHLLGDALLRAVAGRVRGVLRDNDVVARFGGDEFAVLQHDVSDVASTEKLAARICSAVAAPYVIDGNEIHVSASIGISPYEPDIARPEVMMIQADLALYRAKEDGRNCFRFHSADLDREVEERVTITEDLRGAIDRGEIALHYQPQVALASGRIVGMEALLRWNHPTRGLIMPSVFIPVAERTGLIMLLGRWALDEACRQMREWIGQGIAPKRIAVNVSALQFRILSDLERNIADSLARHGVAPELLELELTESVLMEAVRQHSDCFDRLRQLGVRIAIDDFGTGYSSLHYLTTYRVNQVKIAQQLVSKVDSDSRNGTVVRAAVRLARDLDIGCIAEGVESEAQAKFLLAAGCDYAQGYYFSRPADARRAADLLRKGGVGPARPLRVVKTTAA
ncbi:MAG: EAL domain-containing protein [Xanthobacteraceae bacterium]|nr:EAL domain-containing protein [Xanthobacteraceae bacterium]